MLIMRFVCMSFLVMLILASGGVLPFAARAEQHPDIVVILIDDMRADDWPMLADTRRLVGGVEYPNFTYTTPLCCPTRATIQRGQYAHNTHVIDNKGGKVFKMGLDDATIAIALHDAGYFTAYIGKYMNAYPWRAPGWDVWGMDNPGEKGRYWRGKKGKKRTYITDALTDDAIAAAQQTPDGTPLFLMLGHIAPHDPPVPDPKYGTADVGPTVSAFDAERKRTLLSVDDSTERLAAAMGDRWDDACVFVLSDNGYLLGEHGTKGKSIWWDEALRVPLLARCPGLGSGTDQRLAATIDLAPTILRAAGAEASWPMDGRPLQEGWDRAGVLIESWRHGGAGEKRVSWTGIHTADWTYVEPKGKPPALYSRVDGETINHLGDRGTADATDWAAWLASLRDCAGTGCDQVLDGVPQAKDAHHARNRAGGDKEGEAVVGDGNIVPAAARDRQAETRQQDRRHEEGGRAPAGFVGGRTQSRHGDRTHQGYSRRAAAPLALDGGRS